MVKAVNAWVRSALSNVSSILVLVVTNPNIHVFFLKCLQNLLITNNIRTNLLFFKNYQQLSSNIWFLSSIYRLTLPLACPLSHFSRLGYKYIDCPFETCPTDKNVHSGSNQDFLYKCFMHRGLSQFSPMSNLLSLPARILLPPTIGKGQKYIMWVAAKYMLLLGKT